ncbi:hypothetical protein [Faecalibaculum rodentium]|uniref:hypothetical protein n=1 Tax=Faecalibaculum rodentium TaxID=1702221 RepID=UPI0023F057B5|nr:hypothetical protein [Faecalibaculum rodentium]
MEEAFDQIMKDFREWELRWTDENNCEYPTDYEEGRLAGFSEAEGIIEKHMKKPDLTKQIRH